MWEQNRRWFISFVSNSRSLAKTKLAMRALLGILCYSLTPKNRRLPKERSPSERRLLSCDMYGDPVSVLHGGEQSFWRLIAADAAEKLFPIAV